VRLARPGRDALPDHDALQPGPVDGPTPVRPEPVEGPAAPSGLRDQRLVALVGLATLLLTLPPLMPWLHGPPLAGWPRWAWALFGLWAALIAAVAALLESGDNHRRATADEPPP
jgi:hypothetical protein